jgi:hypothetical protein
VAAVKEVHRLKELVFSGEVLAAMELAEIYKVTRLEELLLVVTVHRPRHVEIFDCCADGYALYEATKSHEGRNP